MFKKYFKYRYFVAYFFFINWTNFSLGMHINIAAPNIEVHVPFGFFRLGWEKEHMYSNEIDFPKEKYYSKRIGHDPIEALLKEYYSKNLYIKKWV